MVQKIWSGYKEYDYGIKNVIKVWKMWLNYFIFFKWLKKKYGHIKIV